jgi:peptide/nickel transport system substrate-binding protein
MQQAKVGGYGPAYLDQWIEGERVVMVADPDYPVNPLGVEAGPSKFEHIDEIVMIHYADLSSQRMALEAGQIDTTLGRGIARPDVDDMEANPDINMVMVDGIGSGNQLHMNYAPEFAPLNDVRVRRAIAYAIDPQEIVDKLMFGTAEVAHTPVRTFQTYFKPVLKQIRDLPKEEKIQKAKALLADAGYPDGFTTQFWYPAGGGQEFNRDLGTIIQQQLSEIGVTVELKYIERGVFFDMANSGELPMFTRGWTYDFKDPDTELFYIMHSSSQSLSKRINFNNSYIDDLLVEERVLYNDALTDPALEQRRAEIFEELQDWYLENGHAVMLYYDGLWDAHRTWVKNYRAWETCDKPWQGIWQIHKEIPADWESMDPPV